MKDQSTAISVVHAAQLAVKEALIGPSNNSKVFGVTQTVPNIAFVAPSYDVAKFLFRRVSWCIDELPRWIAKVKINEARHDVHFDNGSTIRIMSKSADPRGLSFTHLFVYSYQWTERDSELYFPRLWADKNNFFWVTE